MQAWAMRTIVTCCLVLTASAGWADPIPVGKYEVHVHLVLPHIDTKDYDFTTEICLTEPNDAAPLGPLGPGPLLKCPRDGAVRGEELIILVKCPGGNAATAIGTYRATPSGFRGDVKMNMGGKNMTLGERQRGRLIGPCK
ncbi:MAG: hypothetical protein AAGH68_11735 [Pseudomonadota bacterium]